MDVDLQLEPVSPPERLYHGTGEHNVAAILGQGLQRMGRHHVHLSQDIETARSVGARHGRPVVIAVDTGAMVEAGFTFYLTANGVWLVEEVPARYLQVL